MKKLEFKSEIQQPVDKVFRFCSSKGGFLQHFPFKTEWLSGPSEWNGVGEKLKFTFRIFGIPIPYIAEITEFERNIRFVDVMRKGPYKFFRHEHLFIPDGESTIYVDRLELSGGFGGLADSLISVPMTTYIFKKRHELMKLALQDEATK